MSTLKLNSKINSNSVRREAMSLELEEEPLNCLFYCEKLLVPGLSQKLF